MSSESQNLPFDLNYIRKRYFSDMKKRITLPEGQIFMYQDEDNDRLYLLTQGQLYGYHEHKNERIKMFTVNPDMFVGVHSFFSGTFKSGATVISRKPSVLYYIDHQSIIHPKTEHRFYKDFMPVVAHELFNRTIHLQEATLEKRDTLKQLIRQEKLVSLGQMAAGIAHELNNALTVMKRNTEWLCKQFNSLIPLKTKFEKKVVNHALKEGRDLSTRETRSLYNQLKKESTYSAQIARILSEMNLSFSAVQAETLSLTEINQLYFKWQVATTLHDMNVSSNQALQVIKSMRILGYEPREKNAFVYVQETIKEALTLVHAQCKGIDLQIEMGSDCQIQANHSELVQIWTNLLNNACQSLKNTEISNPMIQIRSFHDDSAFNIEITDNGPGIPESLQPHIFEPHVTTKVNGLSFGLGLGLAIVEKILSYYNGSIKVRSNPGKTTFSVRLAK